MYWGIHWGYIWEIMVKNIEIAMVYYGIHWASDSSGPGFRGLGFRTEGVGFVAWG